MIIEYNKTTIEGSPFTAKLINRHIEQHTHYFWEFTYSIKGTVDNIVSGVPIKTKEFRKIVLIKPKDTHEIFKDTSNGDNPDEYHRDVYVFPDKMRKICDFLSPTLYNELLNSKNPIVIDCKNENLEALEYTLNLLKTSMSYSKENMTYLEQLHTTVIFQLLGFYLKSERSNAKRYPDWIEDFFEKLKSEEFLRKDIQDIIKEYNYSHGHICREFKKYVNKTMVQALNESRIIYSSILLADKSLSILEIAMRLNFSSQSAYINAFKSIYEVSPNKWRKQTFN